MTVQSLMLGKLVCYVLSALRSQKICHFLLKCKALADTRFKFIQIIRNMLEKSMHSQVVYELTHSEDKLLQLIVDCTKYNFLYNCHTELEKITRNMCYALHMKRTSLCMTAHPVKTTP